MIVDAVFDGFFLANPMLSGSSSAGIGCRDTFAYLEKMTFSLEIGDTPGLK